MPSTKRDGNYRYTLYVADDQSCAEAIGTAAWLSDQGVVSPWGVLQQAHAASAYQAANRES